MSQTDAEAMACPIALECSLWMLRILSEGRILCRWPHIVTQQSPRFVKLLRVKDSDDAVAYNATNEAYATYLKYFWT
jgi:hypothetical protein